MQFLDVWKWCSVNVSLDTHQKHVYWKICKVSKVVRFARVLAVFQEYMFYNVDSVMVRKMSEVFRAKLHREMSDIFY